MDMFSFSSQLSFQSGFPILICNKTRAEPYVQFQNQPPEVFCEKDVLKNFASFTGKYLCWSLFLIKMHVFRPVTLLKRDQHWYFSVKFAKRLRTPILKNIWERLLLQFLSHGRMCIITSKIYQPKIECKDGGSIFRRIKNKDRWKQKKNSVNSFQEVLIFHICVCPENAQYFVGVFL